MTIATTISSVVAIGNSATTVWPYAFLIPTGAAQVRLYNLTTFVDTILDPSLYTITGLDNAAGGTVTYPLSGSPITSGYALTIRRNLAYTQDLNLTGQSAYLPTSLMTQLDKIVMEIQQLATDITNAFVLPSGSGVTSSSFLASVLAAGPNATAAAASAAAAAASAASVSNVPVQINAAVAKATPVDADLIGVTETAGPVLKKATWLQAWTNYFKVKSDLLYAPLVGNGNVVSTSPTANQNNYAPGGISVSAARPTILILTPTISLKITGIDTTGFEVGKRVTLRNGGLPTGAGGRLIILERNSASSTVANRFQYPKSNYDFAPIMLMPGDSFNFVFDGTDLKLAYPFARTPWDQIISRNGSIIGTGLNGAGAASSGDLVETDSLGFLVPYYAGATGTTATGNCSIAITGNQNISFGAGCILGYHRPNIPILSTAGEEFKAWCGFNDADNVGAIVDAIGWRYDRLSSTFWRNYVRANSVETVATGGDTVTANRYDCLGEFVNGDATRVDFFWSADGGETWTFDAAIITNIPSGVTRAAKVGPGILKSAGLTSREVHESSSWMRYIR